MAKQLSTSDRAYIEANRALPVQTLVNATGKTKAVVEGFLSTLEEPKTKEKSDLQKQMALKVAGFGVAVMRQDLAERSESYNPMTGKNELKIHGQNRDDIVFKPNG